MPRAIGSVEEFYAHALAIESEAVERYAEFQAWFSERGEETLAGLCDSLRRMEEAHHSQLLKACAHLRLPAIAAGSHSWLGSGSPEAPARELFYRVAEPGHLLSIALQAELNALDFFNWVGRTCDDPQACALAREMAEEELQHVRWVENALRDPVTTHSDWARVMDGA